MRKPKKLTALLLALTLLFACAACGSGNSTTDSGKTISGTLPEIIDRLYDTVDVDDEQRDFLKNSVGTVEIPKDQSAYYFGVENLDFEEAVALLFNLGVEIEPALACAVCHHQKFDGAAVFGGAQGFICDLTVRRADERAHACGLEAVIEVVLH